MMKVYTVHIQPGASDALEKPEFVREGFNIFAFLFTFLWAFYHRLWGAGLFLIAFHMAFYSMLDAGLIARGSVEMAQLAFQIIVGLQGHDWIRLQLEKKGYVLSDVVTGGSLIEAERRYFERNLPASQPGRLQPSF